MDIPDINDESFASHLNLRICLELGRIVAQVKRDAPELCAPLFRLVELRRQHKDYMERRREAQKRQRRESDILKFSASRLNSQSEKLHVPPPAFDDFAFSALVESVFGADLLASIDRITASETENYLSRERFRAMENNHANALKTKGVDRDDLGSIIEDFPPAQHSLFDWESDDDDEAAPGEIVQGVVTVPEDSEDSRYAADENKPPARVKKIPKSQD